MVRSLQPGAWTCLPNTCMDEVQLTLQGQVLIVQATKIKWTTCPYIQQSTVKLPPDTVHLVAITSF